jgi:uncharacterized membrane protein YraQ (UPF0718 family)
MVPQFRRESVFLGLGLVVTGLALAAGLSLPTLGEIARGYQSFVTIFLGIFIEALPFLLLGTLASGIVEEFVSRDTLSRVVPGNRLGGALAGALMGLGFPVCECGVVPLTRRLYRKGLPLPVGVAFLLAAPVINPVVIASTYAAFGWGPVLLGRIFFTFLIATVVALIFGLAPEPQDLLRSTAWPTLAGSDRAPSLETRKKHSPLRIRLRRTLYVAAEEFFDMGRFLVLGSLLAAAMQTLIAQATLLEIGRSVLSSVFATLALSFVLSVCSTVDAFLALAFVNTFTTGSILGFLVFGPMVDIKSVTMFLWVFRRRAVLYLVLLPLMMALFIGVFVNLNLGW